MRTLRRNRKTFKYSIYNDSGTTEIVDEDGYRTGEPDTTGSFLPPVTEEAAISSSKGEVDVQVFGDALDYDRVITTENTSIAINDHSKVWIDDEPYLIKQIAKSLNFIAIAVKKSSAEEDNG